MNSLPVEMRRMIMEHFSNAELLTISLLNKLFNYEARSLMRDRGNLMADLSTPCRNVLPFLTDLKEMNVVPFSGIKITWNADQHREICPRKNIIVEAGILDVLDRVPLRRLSVEFHGGHYVPKKCPTLQLVKKILQDFSGVLEELDFNNNPKSAQLIQEIVQDHKFPRLQVLKLKDSETLYKANKRTNSIFIKKLVALAPNLQELHRDKMPDLSENLLEGSLAALFVDCDFLPTESDEFLVEYTGTLKLTSMWLDCHEDPIFRERFYTALPKTLRSSSDTLHTVHMNIALLVPFMAYGVSLKRVENLTLSLDYASLELADPRIFLLLKQFDFTRIFPKVIAIDISRGENVQGRTAEFIEKGIAAMKPPLPDRAVNIKQISPGDAFTAEAVPLFAGMFPNIEKIGTRGDQEAPYGLICEYWVDLKELEVSEYIRTMKNVNLDSVFCGIFPEEVALLRDEDEEYLSAVNIVPVMPSLICLRALRTFRHYSCYLSVHRIQAERTDPIFSKVTALVALQRSPNLSVKIQVNSKGMYEAMNPLRPYALVEMMPW